jgi:hypothetical protein
MKRAKRMMAHKLSLYNIDDNGPVVEQAKIIVG